MPRPHPTKARLRWAILALLLAAAVSAGACGRKTNYPNVILISVDTLRADRLGAYGSQAGITGMMDFWAQRGVRFADAWASSPWTLPSHASIFTGLYPTEHRAIDEKINIDKAATMLTERLQKAGFKTGAYVSHYYLGEEYGFGRGFDDFFLKPDAKADDIIGKAMRWLQNHKDENFFLFLHLFDPHTPYQPPVDIAKKHYPPDVDILVTGTTKDVMDVVLEWPSPVAKKKLHALSALYDGEVEFVDKQLEVLFKFLQENALDQKTLIILVSDHGEEFMEHGLMEHGFTLYQEQLRVPFIWYYPAGLPGGVTVTEPVSLIDLMPTLLEFLGLPPADGISGRSLMPLVRGQATKLDRSLLAETTRQGPDRATILRDDKKYIYSPPFKLNFRQFGDAFFDLAADPGERENQLTQQPEAAQKLANELFATGLYVQRRIWHLRWGKSAQPPQLKGELHTTGKFIYLYKENTIYATDAKGLLIAEEFPWEKKFDNKISFVNVNLEENGISFMTEPETAPVDFHLLVRNKEEPGRVWIGGPQNKPASAHFTLDQPVALQPGATPPADGYLIWSDSVWVNAKQVLRAEVGDPIKLSPTVIEHLRSLGYVQ